MAVLLKSLPATIAVTVAATVSFFACAWLLWHVRARLGSGDRRRLFPRQLCSLAAAGLLMTVSAIPIVWVDFWHVRSDVAEGICEIVFDVFRPARFVSAMQETHMALTFLAQVARATKLLHRLNHGIPILWISGFSLSVVDAVLFPYHLGSHEKCDPRRLGGSDVISVCIISVCVLTSCLASIVTLAKSSTSFTTLAVQRRSFKRALWYPCIAMLSYMPIMTMYIFPALQLTSYYPAAAAFELLNGALNAGMFRMQSHYASKVARVEQASGASAATAVDDSRISVDRQFLESFNVLFSGVEVMELH